MKKPYLYFIAIMLIVFCVNPTHDNKYDPDNPAKAYLAGTVYGFDDKELDGADLSLIRDSTVYDTTQSSNGGGYEFTDVDPGIYLLEVKADPFTPVQLTTDLPADTQAYIDIYMDEICCDFEDENIGTSQPTGFIIDKGEWSITQDSSDPSGHSAPNVYQGIAEHNTNPVSQARLDFLLRDFTCEANIKILHTTTTNWYAGLVLRYQDEDNYYLFKITDGYLKLSRFIAGNETYLAEVDTIVIEKDVWYHIDLEFYAQHIKVYFDDQLLFEVDDGTFQEGYVGCYVQSYDPGGGASTEFDDLKIWP